MFKEKIKYKIYLNKLNRKICLCFHPELKDAYDLKNRKGNDI